MENNPQETRRSIILWVVGIGALAFVLLILSIIFNVIPSSAISSQDLLSSSQNVTVASTATLSPVARGITSSEVKANNLTWLEFDGVDDNVEIGNAIVVTDSISIFAKANVDNKTSGNFPVIADEDGFTLYYRNNEIKFWGDVNGASLAVVENTSGWNIIGGIYNYTTNLSKVTLNGAIRVESVKAGNLNTLDETYMGKFFGSYFNGSIDKVKIYNDEFKGMQVKEAYNNFNINKKPYFPVYMLHRVCPNLTVQDTCILNSTLISVMEYVIDQNFTCLTDADLLNISNSGMEMPERPIMFVIDDGHTDNMEMADIMEDYGNCFSTFAVYNAVGTAGYMTWDNITELVNRGHSIASHSWVHCSYDGITNAGGLICNTTENRESNFSESKSQIISNTGYTPISFVFPGNSLGENCGDINNLSCRENITGLMSNYYDMTWGKTYNVLRPDYFYQTVNLSNGDMYRIAIGNETSLEDFLNTMNYTISEPILEYNLNENTGTTAHDTSGNSNDGTISGANWTTDGILVTLTNLVDYTISTTTGLFTITNTDYSWSQLFVSWSYIKSESRNDLDNIKGNYSKLLVNEAAQLPTVGTIIGIVILLAILITLLIFAINKMGSISLSGSKLSNSGQEIA